MSLINEALKKAQRQRTQEVSPSSPPGSPPSPESAPPRRVVKRSQPMPAQTLVIVGVVCLVIVGVVAAGFWILIGPSSQSTNTPAPLVVGSAKAVPSATPATPTTAPTTGTAPSVTGTSQPEPTRTPAATTAGTPATAGSAVVTPTPVGGVASFVFDVKMADKKPDDTSPTAGAAKPGQSAPAATEEGTGEGALHIDVPASEAGFVPPNSRSSAIVDALRISGIRASGTDPKVLMNERVYRLNDVVDHTIGLRLKEINTNNLVFIDETGATYVRNF